MQFLEKLFELYVGPPFPMLVLGWIALRVEMLHDKHAKLTKRVTALETNQWLKIQTASSK